MDAVVRLSGHKEDATNALQSILNNYKTYSKVHLVCTYYEADKEPFPGFNELREALHSKGVPVHVCPSFHDTDCSAVKGDCRLEIHPYCAFKTGGIGKLQSTIDDLEKSKNTKAMHFGVSTTMIIPESRFAKDFVDAITGYGFLLITFYLDMWWRIYSRGKHYLSTDVRTSFVQSTYNRKFVPHLSRSSRVWDNEQLPYKYGGDSAVLKPEPKMRGFVLARYLVNIHNKQVFGLWLLTFFFFFYFWLAYPWWNHLAITPTMENFGADSGTLHRGVIHATNAFVRPVFGPINLVLYLSNLFMLYMSSSYYIIMPHHFLMCCLFPIYMTLYPLFWAYSRLYRPRDTWDIK